MDQENQTHSQLQEKFLLAAKEGRAEDLLAFLREGAQPKAGKSWALRVAARAGHVDCVKLLLPLSDPREDLFAALRDAVGNGHAECAKLLLPGADMMIDGVPHIFGAAVFGRRSCLELLLPLSNPRENAHGALRRAAVAGHADCVVFLLTSEHTVGAVGFDLDGLTDVAKEAVARSEPHIGSLIMAHAEAAELRKSLPPKACSNSSKPSRV